MLFEFLERSIQKLHKAAEKLRAAKMHLIKALRQAVETYCAEDKAPIDRIKKLEVESEEWTSASVEEIIEKYRKQGRAQNPKKTT